MKTGREARWNQLTLRREPREESAERTEEMESVWTRNDRFLLGQSRKVRGSGFHLANWQKRPCLSLNKMKRAGAASRCPDESGRLAPPWNTFKCGRAQVKASFLSRWRGQSAITRREIMIFLSNRMKMKAQHQQQPPPELSQQESRVIIFTEKFTSDSAVAKWKYPDVLPSSRCVTHVERWIKRFWRFAAALPAVGWFCLSFQL